MREKNKLDLKKKKKKKKKKKPNPIWRNIQQGFEPHPLYKTCYKTIEKKTTKQTDTNTYK
jgi:hypothetical protein